MAERRILIVALAIIVTAIVLATAILVAFIIQPEAKPIPYSKISNLVRSDYAREIIENLSAMGTATGINGEHLGFRTSGSDAAIEASEYVRDEMERIGLSNVTMEEIPLEKWEFREGWIHIPGIGKVQAISHAGSGNTSSSPYASPNGSITAEIVDVGNGEKKDYEGKNVSGRIVLSNFNKNLWTNTLAFEAQLHGAIAIVFTAYDHNSTSEMDLVYGWNESAIVAMDGEYKLSYPPALMISGEDGLMLIEMIEASTQPLNVTIFTDIIVERKSEGAVGYNVVGYLPGKNWGTQEDEFVIVGDHTDAYWYGASDNNAGVAAVLCLAEAYKMGYEEAGSSPNRTIIFITHEAEEWGLFGTYYDWCWGAYYEITYLHPEWAGKTVGAIFPDVLGFEHEFGCEYSPELDSLVREVVAANQEKLPYGAGFYDISTYADQWPYAASGIPSIGCWNWDLDFQYQYYHTQFDAMDGVNFTYLNGTIVTIGEMAYRLSNDRIIPYDFSHAAEKMQYEMSEFSLHKVSQLLPIYEEYGIDEQANLTRALNAVNDFADRADALSIYIGMLNPETADDDEIDKINALQLRIAKILGSSMLSIGVWDEVGYLPYTQSLIDVVNLNDAIEILENPLVTISGIKSALQYELLDWVGIVWYHGYISEENYREQYNISFNEGKISFGTQQHLAAAVEIWDEVDRLSLMVENGTVEPVNLTEIVGDLKEKMVNQAFKNLEEGFETMWKALEEITGLIDETPLL